MESERDPRLVPLPPSRARPEPLRGSPYPIAVLPGNALVLNIPDAGFPLARIETDEDRFWLEPAPSRPNPVILNGRAVSDRVALQEGDVIEFVPGARYEFLITPSPPVVLVPDAVRPVPGSRQSFRPDGRRLADEDVARRRRWKLLGLVSLPLLVLLVSVLIASRLTTVSREPAIAPAIALSVADLRLYDSLLTQAYDRIERGTALLSLGLNGNALSEFAKGIDVFETSRIANSPLIRPRIEALQQTVLQIYRFNRVEIPMSLQDLKQSRYNLGMSLRGGLSVKDFQTAVQEVQTRFGRRFNRAFEITGSDHPEHISLYGPGGAMDIRVVGLRPSEIDFLVANFRALGVRVKDFSTDQALVTQIVQALRAGAMDRASTGLHLHVDRFNNRRDGFTVQ